MNQSPQPAARIAIKASSTLHPPAILTINIVVSTYRNHTLLGSLSRSSFAASYGPFLPPNQTTIYYSSSSILTHCCLIFIALSIVSLGSRATTSGKRCGSKWVCGCRLMIGMANDYGGGEWGGKNWFFFSIV